MDLLSQTALLVSAAGFVLGVSALAQNARNKLYLSFAILCAAITGWAFSFFVYQSYEIAEYYRLHLLFNVWLAPAGIYFIQILTLPHRSTHSYWVLGSLLVAVTLTSAMAFGLDVHATVVNLIYFSPSLLGLEIIYLMLKEKQLSIPFSPAVRGKKSIVYIGALIVLLTSLLDHMPSLGPIIPIAGNFLLTIYLFLLSQAITQPGLLNIWAVVTRFTTIGLIALTLATIYSGLFNWIKDSFALFYINTFLFIFVILMLLDPIKALIQHFSARFAQPQQKQLIQAIQSALTPLAQVSNLHDFSESIWQSTQELLSPERSSLYLLQENGTHYRQFKSSHPENKNPKIIFSHHPLLEYCALCLRSNSHLVVISQTLKNEIERSVSRSDRETLTRVLDSLGELDRDTLFPIYAEDRILGFMLMKIPPEYLKSNTDSLDLFAGYYSQAAKVLLNLEFFSRQRQKERLAELGQMAAGLAHEIRNPLGSIQGAIQLLDQDQNHPDKKLLDIIQEEARRLDRVVTRFLEFSKPSHKPFGPVDLNSVIHKTISNLRPGLPTQSEFVWKPSPQPAFIDGDPEQIQQVLINLVLNSAHALKGRTDGRIQIGIQTSQSAPHHHHQHLPQVTLSVEDNGPGIPSHQIDQIFLPFYSTSPQGTGLGLSISQKIIESHQGRIEVQSEAGQYTRFVVTFPRVNES